MPTNRKLHRVGQSYGNKKEEQDNGKTRETKLSEFRRLQERCKGLSDKQVRGFRTGRRELSEEELSSIGGVLGRQIARECNGDRANTSFTVKHKKSGKVFNMQSVNGNLFRDCFRCSI